MKLNTIEQQLTAVIINGFNIKYIKDPSVEVQLEAVKNIGYAIMKIKDPSIKVQLAAIKQKQDAINYCDLSHPQIQMIKKLMEL